MADIVLGILDTAMIKVSKDPTLRWFRGSGEGVTCKSKHTTGTTQDHKMCSRGTSLAVQWLRLALPLWRSGNQDPQFCVV